MYIYTIEVSFSDPKLHIIFIGFRKCTIRGYVGVVQGEDMSRRGLCPHHTHHASLSLLVMIKYIGNDNLVTL